MAQRKVKHVCQYDGMSKYGLEEKIEKDEYLVHQADKFSIPIVITNPAKKRFRPNAHIYSVCSRIQAIIWLSCTF